jgi:hypothetical protein
MHGQQNINFHTAGQKEAVGCIAVPRPTVQWAASNSLYAHFC